MMIKFGAERKPLAEWRCVLYILKRMLSEDLNVKSAAWSQTYLNMCH